jgi:hypothetical protein
MTRSPTELSADSFAADVAEVLDALPPALAAILGELPQPVQKASQLQRALHLDKKLSWCIFNAAGATDIAALPSLLPGRRAMERFFMAAAAEGVSSASIDRARTMYEAFERAVSRHAPRREAFETMVADLKPLSPRGGGASAPADARHKRTAFRAQALLWGREARVTCGPVFVHPSAEREDLIDRVMIAGMVDLQRTRRDVPLHTVVRKRRIRTEGDPLGPVDFEPLDTRESPDSVGLLHDFCTRPLPEFEPVPSKGGAAGEQIAHRLQGNGFGASSRVTFFVGHILRACAPRPGAVPNSALTTGKVIDLPTELYIRDVLMHRSLWDQRPPQVKIYALPTDGTMQCGESDLLPLSESAMYLGLGVDAARTPELPDYSKLLRHAATRMGWDEREFRVFRCRIEYPVLYSWIQIGFGV